MTTTNRDSDHCSTCGSESLFSGWFDEDDLAVPDGRPTVDALGRDRNVRWTTFCNDCGTEQ